jgi:hypothetical protein
VLCGLGCADDLRHGLTHGDARAHAHARAGGAAALLGGTGDRLRHLELGVAAEIPHDPHADALVEAVLQFLRERDVLDLEAVERQPQLGEKRSAISSVTGRSSSTGQPCDELRTTMTESSYRQTRCRCGAVTLGAAPAR